MAEMGRRGNRLMKPLNGSWGSHVPVLISFLILTSVTLILLFGDSRDTPSSSIAIVDPKWNRFESAVQFNPTVEFRNDTELIWQIPASPKAALFIAHGCNGRAINFWDKSPKCPNCVGLPEERLIVLHALARNFAVIAISSAGRCWSFRKERLIVKENLKWWVEKYKLDKLPRVALGASSGGYFISALAAYTKFSSITVMIAEGLYDQIDITKDYPPTLFVHMPKDESRKQKIDENMQMLRDKGIDVAEIKCMEFPLLPNLFSDRVPGIDQNTSVKLFNLFRDKGFVDGNGYMRNDGRETHWKAALKDKRILLPDKNLANHIEEELNLAFAYHEMTSLQSDQIFDWFESHLS